MSDLDLRAGDDDRQETIDRLAAHYRVGRLSDDEFEQRTAVANAARTRGELAELEADLPTAMPAQAPDEAALARRRHLRERVVSAVAISVFLWLIWLATGANGFAWPVIPTGAMLLGVVLDAWGGRGGSEHEGVVLPPSVGLPPLPPGRRRRRRRSP